MISSNESATLDTNVYGTIFAALLGTVDQVNVSIIKYRIAANCNTQRGLLKCRTAANHSRAGAVALDQSAPNIDDLCAPITGIEAGSTIPVPMEFAAGHCKVAISYKSYHDIRTRYGTAHQLHICIHQRNTMFAERHFAIPCAILNGQGRFLYFNSIAAVGDLNI